ncbi:MAG: methyltransferase domain-containing protein [Holosporaceae bacterium]|jgi:malonyl-CoA O-methyltransferase|nr:methyltransferase domain-containing protein [Holosporaceae bacterium]
MKEKIKSSFSRAATTYNSVSEAQVLSSAFLAQTVRESLPFALQKILDIGCGTGHTSLEFMKIWPNADYTLCDISENMIAEARLRIEKAEYIVGDAEKYEFTENYDLGISNLTLQWFESWEAFPEKILKICRRFAFSTISDGSFRDYKKILAERGISLPPLPSAEELKRVCEKHGLIRCQTRSHNMLFENSFALARYFKKLGAATTSFGAKNILSLPGNHSVNLNYEMFFAVCGSPF